MLETTIAGSLPKPVWLAKPGVLWAPWALEGEALAVAKLDATMLSVNEQERCGIDIVTEGEQARQHFVHGFLVGVEGVDFARKKRIGIRNNRYEADCPTVVSELRRTGPVHSAEAKAARAATKNKLKFTLPGPMTIVDTLANEHYRDKVDMAMAFARLLNQEVRELEAIGVDVIQFDEPAFNVYMDEAVQWGIEALHVASEGLRCATAVHICYGYGIEANIKWKETLGEEWRQYEAIFPALNKSAVGGVSLECAGSKVPISLIRLLSDKQILVGAIDVATSRIETPEEVAAVMREAMQHADSERLQCSTNCGLAPLPRGVAEGKLAALGAGARLLRGL
ncbi:MAG: methionine synthase [Rhodoblastus sp.]|nr:methionine synthase [Rhodoblastus sp.]